MKLKMNFEYIVDLNLNFGVLPLSEIEENFLHNKELIDIFSEGNPIYGYKVKATMAGD